MKSISIRSSAAIALIAFVGLTVSPPGANAGVVVGSYLPYAIMNNVCTSHTESCISELADHLGNDPVNWIGFFFYSALFAGSITALFFPDVTSNPFVLGLVILDQDGNFPASKTAAGLQTKYPGLDARSAELLASRIAEKAQTVTPNEIGFRYIALSREEVSEDAQSSGLEESSLEDFEKLVADLG